jgi:hypothetical protein
MFRVLIAGFIGAVVMFAWSAFAHMATPLGAIGISQIENEAHVLGAMRYTIGQKAGLYLFPNSNLRPDATTAEKAAALQSYNERLATYPSGVLVYRPPGASMNMGRVFGVEFAQDLVVSLASAWLVALAGFSGFAARAGFVAGIGVPAVATTNVSYWNWYGFPADYTLAYIAIDWISFVLAGLAIAAVLGFGAKKPDAAA